MPDIRALRRATVRHLSAADAERGDDGGGSVPRLHAMTRGDRVPRTGRRDPLR
jgi:hypothetical protein